MRNVLRTISINAYTIIYLPVILRRKDLLFFVRAYVPRPFKYVLFRGCLRISKKNTNPPFSYSTRRSSIRLFPRPVIVSIRYLLYRSRTTAGRRRIFVNITDTHTHATRNVYYYYDCVRKTIGPVSRTTTAELFSSVARVPTISDCRRIRTGRGVPVCVRRRVDVTE